jgi:hypothetical protein
MQQRHALSGAVLFIFSPLQLDPKVTSCKPETPSQEKPEALLPVQKQEQ